MAVTGSEFRDRNAVVLRPRAGGLTITMGAGEADGRGDDCRRAQTVRLDAGDPRRRYRSRRRPILRAGGTVGLRQVDAIAHDRRPRGDQRRRDHHRRPRRQPRSTQRARRRDGVPELCALSAHDGGGQHVVPVEAGGERRGRSGASSARQRFWGSPAHRPLSAELSGDSASASPWDARSCASPAFLFDEPLSNLDAKLRVEMRTEINVCTSGTHHDRLRHARSDRGYDDGDRIVVLKDGEMRAGRQPAAALRPAGQSFRGRLHRLASDEFHRGHRPTRRDATCRDGQRRATAAAAGHQRRRGRAGGVRHPARAPGSRRRRIRGRGGGGRAHRIGNRAGVRTPGPQEIVGVFRERHEFAPGQKVRLRPRAAQAHLFDPVGGHRL